MSSISTTSDDGRLEKPLVERKTVDVQLQEPPFGLSHVRHKVLDYALFLCRGRKGSRLNSNKHNAGTYDSESNTRLVVLDESGTLQDI